MTPRLSSGMRINALVRRVQAAGGFAAILAKGDEVAGAILVITMERGATTRIWEKGFAADGTDALVRAADAEDEAAVSAYWQRRRERDSDLWVIELDIASAERFAAETIL